MIIVLLRWWYTTGWLQAMHHIGTLITRIEHTLSVSLLLRTLFAPWRRIVTVGGKSIDEKLRAALDNIVSRCIGCIIRLAVLAFALISILLSLAAGVVMAVVWPLLPIAVLFFVARSITG